MKRYIIRKKLLDQYLSPAFKIFLFFFKNFLKFIKIIDIYCLNFLEYVYAGQAFGKNFSDILPSTVYMILP